MAASESDYFMKTGMSTATTMSAPGYTVGATTINVASTTNYPSDTGIMVGVDEVDSAGERVSGTYNIFRCKVASATQLSGVTYVGGDANRNYSAGASTRVYIVVSHARENRLIDGLVTTVFDQDGTLKAGAVDVAAVITDGIITKAKLATAEKTELDQGWNTKYGDTTFPAPNTVTANGNRSYDLVFNSVDLTSKVSAGQRLKLTRTVTAPTQCTDLESGSSQYFSRTSAGLGSTMTFTDDFVVSAWVKLESYAGTSEIIASRYNGTSGWEFGLSASGQVFLQGNNGGAVNQNGVLAYQSVPINKWVHVVAQLDMSTAGTSSTTSYVMIDGVDVPASKFTGGTNPTSLVQAGNLEIGSQNGGTVPFDGKIAQVAIYSAKVTQATIKASMNQGLSGSETSLISAYSFNNSINDLNANANNLTANGGALATATDTPFTQTMTGVTTGTVNYAIITAASFSTNTTLTVQVPEGDTIPTSGGVSAVSYSTQASPYGYPQSPSKRIGTVLLQGSSPTATAITQILGMTQTFTADANKEYKITVQPGLGLTLSQAGSTSAISIWDGTVNSGPQLMESHITSGGTNYGGASSLWWTGKLSAGSHTINLGLRAIGAGTTTMNVSSVAPCIFTIEEV